MVGSVASAETDGTELDATVEDAKIRVDRTVNDLLAVGIELNRDGYFKHTVGPTVEDNRKVWGK